MTLFAEQGLDILFGPITEFFTWLEQVFWFFVIVGVILLIIGIVLTIVASVGLGTIVGKVVNKAVSEELGEEESSEVLGEKVVSEALGKAESGGVVVKESPSEELSETLSSFNQSGSEPLGSSSRGSLLGLVGTFLGLGIIPFTIFTASKAGDYGFQDDWFRPVMWLGLAGGIVFAIAYQRRRIRRLGKDKAGRGLFYFGLVFSAAAIGAMGSVTCTSLAYIYWQPAPIAHLQERLMGSEEKDESDNIIAIRFDARPRERHRDQRLPSDWGQLVAEEVRTVRKIELLGSGVNNKVVSDLHTLPELEELYILSDEIDDQVMPYIAKIKSLKSLTIVGNITDQGFKSFEQMQQLTYLDVGKTVSTNRGMEYLSKLTNLESLVVPEGVTARGLVHLQQLQLKSLILPAVAKTDLGLEYYVAACEPQPQIDLTSWEGMQGPGLIHLRNWMPIRQVTLQVADKALPYVGELAGIEQLLMSESKVSDAAVEHVARLYLHLKKLDVSETNITQQGLARLKLALPGCEITGASLRSRIDRATYQSRYSALEFDGLESYLSVGSFKYDGSHPLTAEAWVWPELEENSGNIMGNTRQGGFSLSLTSERYAKCGFHAHRASLTLVSENSVPVRRWCHVAFVFDGDKVTLFVDGVQQSQRSVPGGHRSSRKKFMIGADPSYTNSPTGMFPGAIREVRLSRTARYDQSFTPAERFQADAETIALYHMDAMQGDRVEDATGNGHTAWINGASWLAGQSSDGKKPPMAEGDASSQEIVGPRQENESENPDK